MIESKPIRVQDWEKAISATFPKIQVPQAFYPLFMSAEEQQEAGVRVSKRFKSNSIQFDHTPVCSKWSISANLRLHLSLSE